LPGRQRGGMAPPGPGLDPTLAVPAPDWYSWRDRGPGCHRWGKSPNSGL